MFKNRSQAGREKTVGRTMRRMAQEVAALLWPPSCLSCGEETMGAPGTLCVACFSALHPICAPYCHRCGEPLAYEALGRKNTRSEGENSEKVGELGPICCVSCLGSPPAWRQARAALVCDAASRQLILPLKYADRLTNARPLATAMTRAGEALLKGNPILVPVPLYRAKLRKRRYNQAALLAQAVSKMNGLDVAVDGLRRCRPTQPLARLSIAERRREMASAFEVRPGRAGLLRHRRVVLVDDVLTSGATAEACVRALHGIGCGEVDVLVAARALAGESAIGRRNEDYAEN